MSLDRRGPMADSDPNIGRPCDACDQPFVTGDYWTLVTIGPGDDEWQQRLCRSGQDYKAVAATVHWACATGDKE